ncbi:MAG: hypothetical protein AAF458_15015 [Pseudomonadota bacterium]
MATHTGPWYIPGAPNIQNHWKPGSSEVPLGLRGRVLRTDGAPVASALVEYWHTNGAGDYPPLRGSVATRRDGSFVIRTVYPGHNQGYRARHIHFVISHPSQRQLITRIYFKNDSRFAEADWPELAILLEEARADGQFRLFGNVTFVLREAN